MSISSGIYIKLDSANYNPLFLLKILLKAGWSLTDHGLKGYLPLGDNGNYDWTFDILSDEQLFIILKEKCLLNELLGVVLTWRDSNIGGEFLFDINGVITISLSINHLRTFNGITDLNWYFEKIIPCIRSNNMKILSIKYEEYPKITTK
jgi:hypothetical protein